MFNSKSTAMKKLLFTIIVCLFSLSLLSQSCFPEGITFKTQTQIDNFQSENPDCTEIQGDVTIGDYYIGTILNLDGLNVLNSIGGGLKIGHNDSLQSLTGLDNLTNCGGNLRIVNNEQLLSLEGLENLAPESIVDLSIIGNDMLSNCEIESLCEYLSAPGGVVQIYYNASGCNNPSEIANGCGIVLPCLPYGNYFFRTQLDIDNFEINYPDCIELEGNVKIGDGDITNLNGLNLISSIGGDLDIGNENLVNLMGLESLQTIGGKLRIVGNENLIDFNGLENLSLIQGDLEIGASGRSGSCTGNPSLMNLDGINNLTYIGGNLNIICNDLLTSITGLESLNSIGGTINILGNYALINLIGLNNLSSVPGDLIISGNSSLIDLNGLENLSSIQGDLKIGVPGRYRNRINSSLLNLDGLINLTSIGGVLYIIENSSLTSLTGLMGVESIEGSIVVWNNAITNLHGLDNIDAGTITSIEIAWNASLSKCEVQSICDYLLVPGGIVDIYNNASGCNSQEEVEEACETVSVDEVSLVEDITTSPNPFTTSTTLSYELKQPEKVTLTIYNHMGKQVYQTQETQPQGKQQLIWNAEGYADGIYYYRLKVGDAVANGKMVKVK